MSSNTTLPAATIKLIEGVFALLRTAADDPSYHERAQGVLALCGVALAVTRATLEASSEPITPVTVPVRRDLGVRVAELAANGLGVREIARRLAVNPSTVSRRLRPKTRC